MGFGSVYSVTDYGRHQQMTDAELIELVRKSSGHQACKVINDDNTVAKYISILTSKDGYSVMPVFEL